MAGTLVTIEKKIDRKSWYRSPKLLRHGVMALFFLFVLHVAYDHQVKGGGPGGTPSPEAYCPFGGVESLYQFLTTGGFVHRIEPSALILFATLVLLTLVAGSGFCGWICPFGSVQEWLGLLGKKVLKRKFNPTGVWDRRLRYLKYVILAVVVGLTWHLGTLVFRAYDPFLAFFHLGMKRGEMPWAYVVLAGVLVGSLWIERFFCKYACPLGAVIGLLSKVALTRIHRDPAACKSCNLCQKTCHAHVEFLSATTIRDADCNYCMDCVVDCPTPNVLTLRGPRWRWSHPVYASMLVAVVFGMVGASQLAGMWQTKPPMVSFSDDQGKLDPENLRGWMTLQEISAGYGVPLANLYQAAGLPERIPATARLNTIASTYNLKFQPDKVREIVRAYLTGQPLQPSATPASSPAASVPAKPVPAPGEEPEVKGFMTLNEIALKTGVPKEHLLRALGLTDVDGRAPVREWMHDHGKTIQDLRDAVGQYRTSKNGQPGSTQ